MKKHAQLSLTEEEVIELMTLVNSHKTEQRYAKRAKAILCIDKKMEYEHIRQETGLSKPAIGK